jgi:hypothetical protein
MLKICELTYLEGKEKCPASAELEEACELMEFHEVSPKDDLKIVQYTKFGADDEVLYERHFMMNLSNKELETTSFEQLKAYLGIISAYKLN